MRSLSSTSEHVALGGEALLDVLQLELLVHVDQHGVHELEQPSTLDLPRLEYHVSVGEQDDRPPAAQALFFPEKAREFRYSLGEAVADLPSGSDVLLLVRGFDRRTYGGRS